MSILELPIEILTLIVTADEETFLAAILAPGIGLRMCHEYLQSYAKRRFSTIERTDERVAHKLFRRLHRDDGPALEVVRRCWNEYKITSPLFTEQYWYRYGRLHRDNDLPAIIGIDGTLEWYQYNRRHRNRDLPAVEYRNGSKEWYRNGNHHRDGDLPAIDYSNGNKWWYKHGAKHRDNGLPAVVLYSGDHVEYWVHGRKLK